MRIKDHVYAVIRGHLYTFEVSEVIARTTVNTTKETFILVVADIQTKTHRGWSSTRLSDLHHSACIEVAPQKSVVEARGEHLNVISVINEDEKGLLYDLYYNVKLFPTAEAAQAHNCREYLEQIDRRINSLSKNLRELTETRDKYQSLLTLFEGTLR